MRRGLPRGVVPLAAVAIGLSACASNPPPETRPAARAAEDRTEDPEFEAARRAARPEFATQADALQAGVYERFVHPDSVVPMRPPARVGDTSAHPAARPPVDAAGDPTTEELLGTLGGEPWYDRAEPPRPVRERPAGDPEPVAPRSEPDPAPAGPIGGDAREGRWTLQLGAYASETGALVRIRQLEREFPDVPRWYAGDGGLWRVYLGRWVDRSGAERARERVAARGWVDAWVTRVP